jgi:hypothetical protein
VRIHITRADKKLTNKEGGSGVSTGKTESSPSRSGRAVFLLLISLYYFYLYLVLISIRFNQISYYLLLLFELLKAVVVPVLKNK